MAKKKRRSILENMAGARPSPDEVRWLVREVCLRAGTFLADHNRDRKKTEAMRVDERALGQAVAFFQDLASDLPVGRRGAHVTRRKDLRLIGLRKSLRAALEADDIGARLVAFEDAGFTLSRAQQQQVRKFDPKQKVRRLGAHDEAAAELISLIFGRSRRMQDQAKAMYGELDDPDDLPVELVTDAKERGTQMGALGTIRLFVEAVLGGDEAAVKAMQDAWNRHRRDSGR